MLAEQALNLDELWKEKTTNAQTVFNAGHQEGKGARDVKTLRNQKTHEWLRNRARIKTLHALNFARTTTFYLQGLLSVPIRHMKTWQNMT